MQPTKISFFQKIQNIYCEVGGIELRLFQEFLSSRSESRTNSVTDPEKGVLKATASSYIPRVTFGFVSSVRALRVCLLDIGRTIDDGRTFHDQVPC